MAITRRAALFGAGLAFTSPAFAAMPASLSAHPGFRAWTQSAPVGRLPLTEFVQTDAGSKRLLDWMDRRPTVLVLWATWCAPCLVEKPHQAALARRLAAAGASTRILALQAFDDGVDFDEGRRMLDRLGARNLPAARAMPAAEEGLRRLFGETARDRSRTILPTVILVGGDGLEMGRAFGTMTGPDGETDYWQDDSAFDFLSRLL